MKLLLAYIYIFGYIAVLHSTATKTYGAFKLSVHNLNICKGPKRVDCCEITGRMNGTLFIYDMYVKKDVIPNRGKITALMNGKELLRLQMKNPCDHLFMKPLFQRVYNTSQNCEFKKGQYNIALDIEEVAHTYYQGMFVYGNMTFKSVFFSDECNFACVNLDVIFSPKNNSTKN